MTIQTHKPSPERQLLRLFVINGLFGIMLGAALAGVMIAFNVHGLGGMALDEKEGIIAIAMLAAGLSVTFGGAAIATAIMLLDWDTDDAALPEALDGFSSPSTSFVVAGMNPVSPREAD